MGKEGEAQGDSLDLFRQITQEEIEQFFLNPHGPLKESLLGNASTRIVYDTSRLDISKRPNFRATIERETHASDIISGELKTQISFSFYDGFGRNIQSKIQADPQEGMITT